VRARHQHRAPGLQQRARVRLGRGEREQHRRQEHRHGGARRGGAHTARLHLDVTAARLRLSKARKRRQNRGAQRRQQAFF
jgi:hypothetical protein